MDLLPKALSSSNIDNSKRTLEPNSFLEIILNKDFQNNGNEEIYLNTLGFHFLFSSFYNHAIMFSFKQKKLI